MCLSVLLERKLANFENWTCYKLFVCKNNVITPLCQGKNEGYKINELLKSDDFVGYKDLKELRTEDSNATYPLGFHAWTDRSIAEQQLKVYHEKSNKNVVVKCVKLSKIVAIGYQATYYGHTFAYCMVGQEMIILPE